MRNIGTPVDFNKNEARNLRAHILASAPGSPVTGQIYYNSGDNNLYVWDGGAFVDLTAQGTTAPDADAVTKGIVQLTGDLAGTAASPQIATGVIVNADVNAAAAIAYSKLNLATSIVNADVSASAAIAYSKLNLATSIVNADINASAAIALSKLAVDPLARANHTGTQLANTISNFDTQVRTSTLNQMASPTTALAMNAQKISGLADGTAATDGVTKQQLDAVAQGVRWLGARMSSTATFSEAGATATTLPVGGTTLTVDGIAAANGDYILAKNQTTAARNGLYVVSGIGSSVVLTRAPEMDTAAEQDGRAVLIEDGSTLAGTVWMNTTDVTTLGTDPVNFVQFNKATDIVGGSGLTLTGTTLDVNVDSSSIEVNADTLRVKALGITNAMLAGSIAYSKLTLTGSVTNADLAGSIDLTTKVTGALPIANGGTGQTAAKAARETGLVASGYYTSATHGAISAGGTLTVTQATHGLRSSRGLGVWTIDEATGDHRLDDINVASNGDVVVTYAQAQGANSIRIVIVG